MSKPKPRLPKVWIRIDRDGEARDGFATKPKGPSWLEARDALHLYAPVTKPKVCEWYQDGEGSFWVPACVGLDGAWEFANDGPSENECIYCMRCGGKIKVKR